MNLKLYLFSVDTFFDESLGILWNIVIGLEFVLILVIHILFA